MPRVPRAASSPRESEADAVSLDAHTKCFHLDTVGPIKSREYLDDKACEPFRSPGALCSLPCSGKPNECPQTWPTGSQNFSPMNNKITSIVCMCFEISSRRRRALSLKSCKLAGEEDSGCIPITTFQQMATSKQALDWCNATWTSQDYTRVTTSSYVSACGWLV